MSKELLEIPTSIKLQITTKYYLAVQAMLRRVEPENIDEDFIRNQFLDFTPMTPEEVSAKVAEQIKPDLDNQNLLNMLAELDGMKLKGEDWSQPDA